MFKRVNMFGAKTKARILVVDDDPSMLSIYAAILQNEGAECTTAQDGQAALDLLRKDEFDLLITDLIMSGVDGLMLLSEIEAAPRPITAILITGQDEYLDLALEATRLGAYDFLCKPVLKQQLLAAVARALEYQHLLLMNQKLTKRLASPPIFRNLLGRSPVMLDLFCVIAQVARTKANILITGEDGTGRECVARAIHAQSDRKGQPLSVIDCSTIPQELMESALFGYRGGAFPGADPDHAGLLQCSNGGTLFFDEIGELSLPLQEKVLQVVRDRSFVPIGATREENVDIRIIAATNRDLRSEVRDGSFREDLYRRLNVIPVRVPSLRERREDIRELAHHFLDILQEGQPNISGISPQAIEHLMQYPWPGNVRELRDVIEQAIRHASTDRIVSADLPKIICECEGIALVQDDSQEMGIEKWDTFMCKMKRDYFSRLLLLHGGNVSKAAISAGISRKVLYRYLKDSDIDPLAFRQSL